MTNRQVTHVRDKYEDKKCKQPFRLLKNNTKTKSKADKGSDNPNQLALIRA